MYIHILNFLKEFYNVSSHVCIYMLLQLKHPNTVLLIQSQSAAHFWSSEVGGISFCRETPPLKSLHLKIRRLTVLVHTYICLLDLEKKRDESEWERWRWSWKQGWSHWLTKWRPCPGNPLLRKLLTFLIQTSATIGLRAPTPKNGSCSSSTYVYQLMQFLYLSPFSCFSRFGFIWWTYSWYYYVCVPSLVDYDWLID